MPFAFLDINLFYTLLLFLKYMTYNKIILMHILESEVIKKPWLRRENMKRNIAILLTLVLMLLSFANQEVKAKTFTEEDLDIKWIKGDYDLPLYSTDTSLIREGYIVLYADDYKGMTLGEKMIILDMDGEKFIPESYDLILYRDGFFRLFTDNSKNENEVDFTLKIIDKNRKEWTEGEWTNKTSKYKEGYKIHFKDGKYGYMDEDGEIAIPYNYLMANNFVDGVAAVYPSKNLGQIINKKGEVLVETKVSSVYDLLLFGNGFYRIDGSEGVSLKSIEGENYLDGEYDFFYIVSDDLYRYKKDAKVGVANKSGSILLEMDGNDVSVYGNIIKFYTDEKIIYKNINGSKLVEVENDKEIHGGLSNIIFDKYIVYYNDDRQKHILDENGREVNIFDAYNFTTLSYSSDGLLQCNDALTDEPCYVDEKGNKIISMDGYDLCTDFKYGYAWVTKTDEKFNTVSALINKKGEKILNLENIINYDVVNESLVCVKRFCEEGRDENGDLLIELGIIDLDALKTKSSGNKDTQKASKSDKNTEVKAITTPCNLSLDGKKVDMMEAYLINDHNYFKLRDIAMLAGETDAKFSVAWNGDKKLISLVIGQPYEAVGTELKDPDMTDKTGIVSNSKLEVNGKELALDAYLINNENYYQIRDLAKALDFGVEWNNETKTVELKMNK